METRKLEKKETRSLTACIALTGVLAGLIDRLSSG